MANSDNKAFDMMTATADKTAVFVDDTEMRAQEYENKLLQTSFEQVKGTKAEKSWFDVRNRFYGSVSKDKRNIVQRKADELYQSGPVGAVLSAAADIVPGIPYVDIIDPPKELTGEGMQSARNILGTLGTIGSVYKTPQAVGRVATNIREPWGYENTLKKISRAAKGTHEPDWLQKAFQGGASTPSYGSAFLKYSSDVLRPIKNITKSIIKDKPLYSDLKYSGASGAARETLYRKMFGLKPRLTGDTAKIFTENADGTLSFNMKNAYGLDLLDDIAVGSSRHPVMGGYSRKAIGDKIAYEDIWDFKMNPSDWNLLKWNLRDVSKRGAGLGGNRKDRIKKAARRLGEAGLRSLVDAITKPSHIKGTVSPKELKRARERLIAANKAGPTPKLNPGTTTYKQATGYSGNPYTRQVLAKKINTPSQLYKASIVKPSKSNELFEELERLQKKLDDWGGK